MIRTFVFKLIVIFVLLIFSSSVFAQGYGNGHGHGHWHGGNIHRFELHDRHVWRGGGWHHVRYGGRLGWWWVVGPSWYYYSRPVYPYPDPYLPPVVWENTANQTAPTPTVVQNWYYCEKTKEYYPYVATCPGGWKTVPATPAVEETKSKSE